MLKKLIKLLINYNPLASLLLMLPLLQVVVQKLSKRKLNVFLGGRLKRKYNHRLFNAYKRHSHEMNHEKQEVVIEKVVRNKRKCITTVKGLELFGVKLSDASKKLGKKFATGASVVKGPNDKEQIDVQGDISYDVVEFITETWPNVILLSFSFPYNALCWGQMCLHFFVLYSMVGLAGQPGTSGFQPDPMGSVFFFFENQVLGQIKYY
ncbi:translation machinery-associated protein 22-like isoform X3 [Durio zibethinus]|uniref:Translation machinery-associated protein 22 n=1 Tax=Durio zibethinus TaxID=66656 RepID=A0A6P5XN60_DURZI|nr:translation machinery-associated protein 22-like isoform X3 [Durio zibethinus]XP_022729800.1 translation machinery-associated protein 22-like isoform X3 [Durio zibethinus]